MKGVWMEEKKKKSNMGGHYLERQYNLPLLAKEIRKAGKRSLPQFASSISCAPAGKANWRDWIAFNELNPFPQRAINSKRSHHFQIIRLVFPSAVFYYS
ncbi:hypothetical protein TNCT_662761 [Trichonephila clavata]|uniref:Uncharacterized protein n=1 Tax=Trichonephila clavata TaxID=2740835 RepID=A0A8X6LJD3_TRICU|nr:hypothetical protein TNCT_662761 [Trichonephila clavata]